jgi:putative peptidoglycan lipid II flippase
MLPTQQLLRTSIIVMMILGLNKLTGFVKLLLMTNNFGTGPEADAFTAANQLPELFDTMLAGGALAAALIPVYTAYLGRQAHSEARTLANTVVTLTLIVMGGIGAVTAWLALPITQWLLVPEFSVKQQLLTAELMRIILLSMTLFSIGSIFASLLQAHQHFIAPAFAGFLVDVGQIIGLYTLAPEWGIYGVAWGSVIGAVLAWLIQIPPFLQRKIATRLQLAWRLPGLHELARLMGPRIVTLGVVQFVDLIFLRLASPLPTGSIAAYYYALLIMVAMPKSLFGLAITTVFFPTLAHHYNAGDRTGMQRLVQNALLTALLLVIPGAIGLLALGPTAVSFLLERGAFDAAATQLVYTLLIIFAVRLIAETAHDILVLPFFASHNTKVPMWVNLGSMALNIGLSYALVGPWQIQGLAIAATGAAAIAAIVLYWLARNPDEGVREAELWWGLGRIGVACLGMSVAVIALQALALPPVIYLAVAIILGGLVYLALLLLLGGRSTLSLLAQLWPRRAS